MTKKTTTFKQDAKPQGGWKTDPPPSRHIFILSGGIGAGKTTIINRLKTDFHFVSGSPADVMKEALAKHIALQYDGMDGTDLQVIPDSWREFYAEMLDQKTKAEYRLLLQGWGEFFSNRDEYYWADQCVAEAKAAYENVARAGVQSGIIFDSIRRPQEILAVKREFPQAVHVRLVVDHERQVDYLTRILGYDAEKAEATLAHSSEHWLDDMDGTEYDAQYVIDANADDETTWLQFMAIVVLLMSPGEKEVAEAILDG